MREYQYKYIIRTLLYSPVTIVILFLVIILLLRSIMALNNKRIAVDKLRDDATAKQEETAQELNKATSELSFIKTSRGFEEYVRTTYPVAKPGEGVIVVYDEPDSPVTSVREQMTVWERLLVAVKPFFTK